MVTGEPFYNGDPRRKSVTWFFEKGVSLIDGRYTEIIKADMQKFPDLYKGENLKSYTSKFKKENKVGKRKLSPGDELRFPETLASIKIKSPQLGSGGL